MVRYQHKGQAWNAAMNRKFQLRTGSNLYGRYRYINSIIDGYRMPICSPSVAKDIFYNSYVATIPTILFLVVVGVNGMILDISDAYPGCEQDASATYLSQAQTHLHNAGLIALSDSIFPFSESIKPLPSED